MKSCTPQIREYKHRPNAHSIIEKTHTKEEAVVGELSQQEMTSDR
jgi:hypothetical protein